MLRAIDELFWVLRRDGFTISTAQAIDAANVAAIVGFDDKETLRDAIAAVVVERRGDRDAFRESFDRFFSSGAAHATDLWGRLADRGATAEELAALRELLEAIAERSGVGGEAFGATTLTASDSELDRLLMAAGIARTLAPMTNELQAGYFAHQVMEQIGVPKAASALKRLEEALREAFGEERARALAKALAAELDRVKRRVRDHVDRALRRKIGGAGGGERRREDKPFTSLSATEIEEVRRAVRRLAERLRGGERVRRRRALHGRIDPHRTLRKSLRTGGIPFQPARKRRRRDKPRLWILCDVSDSVRTASLFLLELAHAAQELFSGTRSFVFVSEIGETTSLFANEPVASALAKIYAGAVVSPAHNSNYHRVLVSFEERFGKAIDRRTTIVILGDGRTNYLGDAVDVIGRLREKARAVLWICPEAPGTWGSGDSAMVRYAGAVTKVLVARTAKELESAAREVVARRK